MPKLLIAAMRGGRKLALAVMLPLMLADAANAQVSDGQARALSAVKAQMQGNLDQALTLFGEALSDTRLTNDRRGVILTDRGALYARMNRPKEAIEDFNRAVLLYPEYPAVYNNRGSTLLTVGLVREAVKDFDRAILLAPGYVAAFANRANAKLLLGQSQEAIADFTKAVSLAPETLAALAGRGRALMAANRPQAAIRDFSRAIQADPRFALGYRSRAEARLMAEQYSEAVEDLSRAIAFDPNGVRNYLERGQSYMASGDAASAIKDFSKAIEINPTSVEALEARALALLSVDSHNEAEGDLVRALQLNSRSAAAIAVRAMLYQRTRQPALARSEINRAVKLAPKLPEVLLARGEIEEAAGKRQEAIASLRAALGSRSTQRYALVALGRLGAAPDGGDETVPGVGVSDWRVVKRGNRMLALSQSMPKLQVPIEMAGKGLPRLIAWEEKAVGDKGIGLLRISVGHVDGRKGPEEVEQVAIIDLETAALLGVVPDRQGDNHAKWKWEETKLLVDSVDGLKDEFVLRARRPVAEAPRRRYSEGPRRYDTPAWMPWSSGWGQPQPSRRDSRQRRSQPKTLFDILLGN
jgi:tetratricopeptide (TPR) repeat protein